MQIFHGFNLLQDQWPWIILAAFFIGFSKTGISSFMIPAIVVGAFLGVVIIKKLNERLFHLVILGVTVIASVRLLIP